jgi:hypothetical protein
MAPTYLYEFSVASFILCLCLKSVCFFTKSDGSKNKDFYIMDLKSEILMGPVAIFIVPDREIKLNTIK